MSSDTETITKTAIKLKTPSLWKVVLHNDDFTPFDFVIQLLILVFQKSVDEAAALALNVHTSGKATVGIYSKEIAVSKTEQSKELAEQYEHPLLVTAEEA